MVSAPAASEAEQPDPMEVAGHCNTPPVAARMFAPGTDSARVEAVLLFGDKWLDGTELRYHFFEARESWTGTDEDKDVVRSAFRRWKEAGIGLEFREVADPGEAEVRIGFDHDDGSWSYLGRQVLSRPATALTMNFGWKLAGWSYGFDTALHEIGHTLGLPHEHQNPNAGIVWDEEAVYGYFAGTPNNWPPDRTEHNILHKLTPDLVRGSAWDRDSIMHYAFPAGLIFEPEEYRSSPLTPAPELSDADIDWIRQFYPALEPQLPELHPFESRRLSLAPGEQVDFVVRPENTLDYHFQTFGKADTVLALFEEVEGEDGGGPRFLAGDDDSGTAFNAAFDVKLFKGRTYYLRLRLYWSWASGTTAVMMS